MFIGPNDGKIIKHNGPLESVEHDLGNAEKCSSTTLWTTNGKVEDGDASRHEENDYGTILSLYKKSRMMWKHVPDIPADKQQIKKKKKQKTKHNSPELIDHNKIPFLSYECESN